eukprot:CAMPEP_0113303270 /NCGR_PEP_ID=MMETSP0010_2-20120614/3756_1 /TAXON_ID=216773 ORGANISM="Corethron hystrix, Strain 308" /NCGR_SAMPLE_ID=MMETSP0010_2 /ASSEMBLY_ACC=CAM_ASM_000155 /LENGTH=207 /DNA_ID=CAMNT_0000157239 /DNA_START=40 /DNA_END=660 /DNA_ORIENTATION=+ /assembly_acc=CAM_ASM_000155
MVRTLSLFLLSIVTTCVLHQGSTAFSTARICRNELKTSSQFVSSRRDVVTDLIVFGGIFSANAFLGPLPAFAEADFLEGSRGLKYQVLSTGAGPSPERGQKLKANYVLTLNGFKGESSGVKEIDSSSGFLRGPFSFRAGVGEVIKGWDLAVMDMKAGEKRRLIIPSEIGYGEKGAGGKIPGGATLYFEIELLELEKMEQLSDAALKW